MLLLHDDPAGFADRSPDEIQRIIGEYIAWRQRLESNGKFLGGEKLRDEGGRHLSLGGSAVRIVDGPYTEAKEIVGGYFLIDAASYEEAATLCCDCPHLKYGRRIELREIDELKDH
jgi:hypothetical protein